MAPPTTVPLLPGSWSRLGSWFPDPLALVAADLAGRFGLGPAAAPSQRIVWITSVTGDADHAVTIDDMGAVVAEGTGLYPALCGRRILPAAMTAPPARVCTGCAAVIRARLLFSQPRFGETGRHRKPGALARLFGRSGGRS